MDTLTISEFVADIIKIILQFGLFGLIIALVSFSLNKKLENFKGKQAVRSEIGKLRAHAFITVFSNMEKLSGYTNELVQDMVKEAMVYNGQDVINDKKLNAEFNSIIEKYKSKFQVEVFRNYDILDENRFLLLNEYEEKAGKYLRKIGEFFFSVLGTGKDMESYNFDNYTNEITETGYSLKDIKGKIRNELLMFE